MEAAISRITAKALEMEKGLAVEVFASCPSR
jgi:hypothetical protein